MLKKHTQDSDIAFPDPPKDSVSCICVNGNANTQTSIVCVGAWDNSLSCYEINTSSQTPIVAKRGILMHEAPVLCCDFTSDGQTCVSAGCDGFVRVWNVTQPNNTASTIGKHDQPIRCIKFLPDLNVVVTGSWDKSFKVWDPRSPTPAHVQPLEDRVYALDAKGSNIVVGTADKNIHVFDSCNKLGEFRSPLNYQTRCISIFEDNSGFAVGSIEGRVAIEYYNEMQYKASQQKPQHLKSFVFKCHRHDNDVYAVNAIDFHKYNTFCTAGSDGVFSWWDKDARHRLGQFEKFKKGSHITSAKFSPTGNVMFYSLSYDWSKGASYCPSDPNATQIMLHPVVDAEIQRKPAAPAQGGGFGRR